MSNRQTHTQPVSLSAANSPATHKLTRNQHHDQQQTNSPASSVTIDNGKLTRNLHYEQQQTNSPATRITISNRQTHLQLASRLACWYPSLRVATRPVAKTTCENFKSGSVCRQPFGVWLEGSENRKSSFRVSQAKLVNRSCPLALAPAGRLLVQGRRSSLQPTRTLATGTWRRVEGVTQALHHFER